MNERGVYNSIELGKQLISFEGIQYGTITPTDIDGCIEYHQKDWVWYECKRTGVMVSKGQRKTLNELAKDLSYNKHAIVIIIDHNVINHTQSIPLKECIVREYKIDNRDWQKPSRSITAKELSDIFIRSVDNPAWMERYFKE